MAQSAALGVRTTRPQTTPAALAPIWMAAACALAAILCLAIPIYVIRPFRPQGPRELALALNVRSVGPWISGLCAVIALFLLIRSWKQSGVGRRTAMVALTLVATLCGLLTHINIFDQVMFHAYDSPVFASAKEAMMDSDDKLLAVTIAGESHGYPIRTMGYHHIVNDTVGGVPIAVTYCTLCHTGLVWNRSLDGDTLHFRLAGINNGNALIQDQETHSIWQQSTGKSIFGPFRGRALQLVRSDELTFALWKMEQPNGKLLKPDARYAEEYDPKDWEKHVEKTHVVFDTRKSGIEPHQLMLGVLTAGQATAYPIKLMLAEKLIQDESGQQPLVLVVGPDQASIRVFLARLPGEPGAVTFVRTVETAPAGEIVMVDPRSGSLWNFRGCAVEGKWAGHCLTQVDANQDYWFDWLNHHPGTRVYHD